MALWIGVFVFVMAFEGAWTERGKASLYFPMAEVSLRLPAHLPPGTELLRTRALPLPSSLHLSAASPAPEYVMRVGAPPWLRATRGAAGDLLLSLIHAPPLRSGPWKAIVEARPSGTSEETISEDSTTQSLLQLELVVLGEEETHVLCTAENATAALCFWPETRLQVLEEAPGVDLGSPGPAYLQRFCSRSFHYKLHSDGALYMEEVKGDEERQQWRLRSAPTLDREEHRGSLLGELVCSEAVGADENAAGAAAARELHVDLIDRDDNSPKLHSLYERVYLNTAQLTQGSRFAASELLLQDPDSSPLQRFDAAVLEDPLDVWGAHCDPPMKLTFRWQYPHSAAVCYLIPRRNLSIAINSEHNVTILLNDTTMERTPGKESHVVIHLTLIAGSEPIVSAAQIAALGLGGVGRSGGGGGSGGGRPKIPRAVLLPRWAARLARVARPRLPLTTSIYTFSLEVIAPGPAKALAITKNQGIIYVEDPAALAAALKEFSVVVRWKRGDGIESSSTLRVSLEGSTESCSLRPGSGELHCADADSAARCEARCGKGVGSARPSFRKGDNVKIDNNGHSVGACTWRSTGPSLPHAHANYSTCTPDVSTCPDRECDELEELDEYLCPQDCVRKNRNDVHVVYNEHNQGIHMAPGICSCAVPNNCVCLHRLPPAAAPNLPVTAVAPGLRSLDIGASPTAAADDFEDVTESEESPDAVLLGGSGAGLGERCGAGCMMSAAAGGIALLTVVIVAVLAISRRRSSGKGRNVRKLASPAPPASSEGSRSRPPTSGVTSPATNIIRQSLTTDPEVTAIIPDPRWEFPRAQLVLEQPLGEGEFGQVLRARALNIAGLSGWTTVAVKTLKPGAESSELADLLSEFSLLRGVNHPNVVRLLGACAEGCAQGQPFLLVMEFAEHGSLRSYLRRGRHAGAGATLPCSAPPDGSIPEPTPAPAVPKVAPRDVLAFAWQISKGMAYLSDIKLIHRDLAARNVLVAEGGICKVSDFGLTRDVYEDDTYLKRSKGRVPVKWMSLESLADHMYTSKSDVWSFGVLLWELVTLGASPYPGVPVHNLFHLLKAGYRMQRPENCSLALYQIMRSCWFENPDERPSFKELTTILEKMLQDGVDYLDLNPRTVHNMTYFTSLSSPRNILENVNLNYGNLTLLPVDSMNYTLQEKQKHAKIDTAKCKEEEEEERLLQPPVENPSVNTHDLQKVTTVTEIDKNDNNSRFGNAYLSPIHQVNSLPRDSINGGSLSHVPPMQRYISMSVGEKKRKSRHPPDSSPVGPCLKVTTF